MKALLPIPKICGCLLAAALIGSGIPGLYSQTIDIADFLPMDPGNEWYLSGSASLTYSGTHYNPDIAAQLTTHAGSNLHGVPTTMMELQGVGNVFVILFNVEFRVTQQLWLSLNDTGLYLHHRVGMIHAAGSLEDYDEEEYYTPAMLLPRLIEVGHSYPFTAELTSGIENDSVYVAGIETIETAMGSVEAIKLVLFNDGDVPVVLWLGRGVGCTKAQVSSTFDESPLTVDAILDSMNSPWEVSPIDGLWAATLSGDHGWRFADWMSDFWAPSIDSPWIYHEGFLWAYCTGDPSSLWAFFFNVGWLWTNEDIFPFVYNVDMGKFLYFVYDDGTYRFFDIEAGEYLPDP